MTLNHQRRITSSSYLTDRISFVGKLQTLSFKELFEWHLGIPPSYKGIVQEDIKRVCELGENVCVDLRIEWNLRLHYIGKMTQFPAHACG